MGIERYDYFAKADKPIALALGYFDSVHLGHLKLIEVVKNSGYSPFVFTFTNNPAEIIAGEKGQIFTLEERLIRFEKLGVEGVITANFDRQFMNTSGEIFLSDLIQRFNIRHIVMGKDYSCGVGGSMTADKIMDFLAERKVFAEVLDLYGVDGVKLSSTTVRKLIAEGNVEVINKMLPMPYSINGCVVGGRRDGSKILGYPTANISFTKDKLYLKEGVYFTKIRIGEEVFSAVTNVGSHPTFDDFDYNIESFILDFDGDIYDEQLEVVFLRRIRDTVKFSSVYALKEQITNDIKKVRGWLR